MKMIDFRSDTVTRPGKAMLEAMMTAEVGDDVYGEDPTVNKLEAFAADRLGTEAAIFCPSGTQSNLLALLVHCGRGDEYLVGQNAHTYVFEGGGAAVLGSIQPQPILADNDGTLNLNKVEKLIKPDDFHFARTRLLCLENTHLGKILPLDYLARAREMTLRHGLKLHLDGARIFNAAVKLNVDVKQITNHFDSISCCLSKGLGAPVGSVLCGSQKDIKEARKWRKMLGGAMRQTGFLAAAGIYALENNITRLKEDHDNALELATRLNAISQVTIAMNEIQTNIFFAKIDAEMEKLCQFLKEKGILINSDRLSRFVTHLDISREDVEFTIGCFKAYFKN